MSEKYDAIIIGAGVSGMYQLYKLREQGMSVKVFEAGSGVGGTWYWNKYPGCRFDSESETYAYSWSKEVMNEWTWTEHFAPQPETEKYLNFVADKFNLRDDIQFNSRVSKATWNEADKQWDIELEDGSGASATFLVSATGPLSAFQLPKIDGIESFEGQWTHTARYPKEGLGNNNDFSGLRVGVIGTGATGVQFIQEAAKTAKDLYVFQLAPEWCAPLKNSPITPEEMDQIRAEYDDIFSECKETFGAFRHKFDERSIYDVSEQEREERFEYLYDQPGFGIWLGNFPEIMSDLKANKMISDFIAKKIRQRVNDPEVAEKLIPKNHGFGTRRVPMETKYFECYNQDNVHLVSLPETPIERVTPKGVQCSDQEYELDIIVYATGFEGVMGALNRIDITGKGGQKLKEKWVDGPRTMLGLQINGFPNLLTLVGPHNGATFCNIPRCAEQNVEWVSDLLGYMRDKGLTTIEPTTEAEDGWTEHVNETVEHTLFPTADSWFMGVNPNNPDKKRTFMLYAGGQQNYRAKCDEAAANDYEGFVMS
ncbi:MAG TPA: cyclohexanone monooxygenase [Porticoccaceae bacterium]|nr:cyclohexanone monooxygenase [Porticoccaceae bacterium]HCO60948.1 cyclohexanone monooxygenase [Porticoccaceae bacterium]